jgi:DNA-binding LacI/PurR family transcriptional regulator
MKNDQITIRDIALKLGVSISTVSRALRNVEDINPETKKVVLETAKKLNYEPNRIAQSLRSKKTNILGVLVPQINLHFFSSAISGIQEYASRHHYSVIICQSLESLQTEEAAIHALISNRVDGLLISLSSETNRTDHLQPLLQKKIPIVLFDRVADGLNATRVIVDDYDGAFKAVEHLIKTGCKRIAYMGGPSHLYISNQRKRGYLEALKKYEIRIDDDLIVHCDDLQIEPALKAEVLLNEKERPDAFFCLNDPIAIMVMQVIKSKQLNIPNDVSIIGFTNEPVSQYIEPSLTTVSQPSYEIGEMAASLFIEQIEHKESFVPVTKVLPTKLVLRNSTRAVYR